MTGWKRVRGMAEDRIITAETRERGARIHERMRRLIPLLFLIVSARAGAEMCRMSAPDLAFVESAKKTWEAVRADALRLAPAPPPLFIFFDETCVWRDGAGQKHSGTIAIPGGGETPARVLSFAGSDQGRAFLVMALPSVWRTEARHRDNPRLDLLLRCVFVHEMTHTRQTQAFTERLDEIEAKYKIEIDDDIVQTRFAEREGFRSAYEAERDLLFATARKADGVLAKHAVRMAKDRRARFFTNDDAVYAELEEIFLGMEGVAQWAAVRAAMREGLAPADAIAFIRRDGKRWSQDEGLALFLAIDALLPRWQKRVFGVNPAPVWRLLEESGAVSGSALRAAPAAVARRPDRARQSPRLSTR